MVWLILMLCARLLSLAMCVRRVNHDTRNIVFVGIFRVTSSRRVEVDNNSNNTLVQPNILIFSNCGLVNSFQDTWH